jgi:hypothetical protein
MAEIINLRRVRKAKTREDQAHTAAENRLKFGQSKAEKKLLKAESLRVENAFAAHKRDE